MNEGEKQYPHEILKRHLEETGDYITLTELLLNTGTYKEIFKEIWKKENIVEVITSHIPRSVSRKDDKLSIDFLWEGQKLMKEGKFSKALLKLNSAVLVTSHPKKNKYELTLLGQVYAIRSALLYKMERYAETINDINRAYKYGYPENTVSKEAIFPLKIQCLLNLKKINAAVNEIECLIEKAKKADDDNWLQYLHAFQKMYKINKNSFQNENDSETAAEDIFQRDPENLFWQRYDMNNYINKNDEKIMVSYSENRGRHIIAKKNILPGEILMVENAICSIPKLEKSALTSYCCVCLGKTFISLPCNICSLVTFCSEDCITSQHNNHQMECSILPILLDMKIDEELGLVIRSFLKFTMEEILSEIESNKNSNINFLPGITEARSFAELPTTYLTLTKLNGHWNHRSGDCILKVTANAILGVKLLQGISEFWTRKNESVPPIEMNFENLTTLGGEIIKLLLNFPCNGLSLTELQLVEKEGNVRAFKIDFGYGVYKLFSLLNHSCAPNACRSSSGDVQYLYSINFIPEEHEVTISYGANYNIDELEKRRHNLSKFYNFYCECKACKTKWPLYSNLPNTFVLLCPICENSVNYFDKVCSSCIGNIRSIMNDLKAIKSNINAALLNYDVCNQQLKAYKTSFANIQVIGNYLLLLNTHTNVPHKPFTNVQVMLQNSFELIGNFSFKNYLDR